MASILDENRHRRNVLSVQAGEWCARSGARDCMHKEQGIRHVERVLLECQPTLDSRFSQFLS